MTEQLNFIENQHKIKSIIKKIIKQNKQVVHGARAINAQVSWPYQRETKDYDIFSNKKAGKAARNMERALDKGVGGDFFYTKKGITKGVFKVFDKGFDQKRDTPDDSLIADYMKKPKGVQSKKIEGIKYRTLADIKKSKIALVNNPQFEHRKKKDLEDIRTINVFLKTKGRKKK